jgi:predicted permease
MWIDRLLVAMFSANAPTFAIDVAPDARVLGFTCLVSVIAFAVFAIVPTLASSRVDASALGAASRRVIGHRDRPRQIVIIAQVALTMVLTAAGSAFVQELRRLQTEPLGLNLERVISAQLSPVPGGYQPPFAGGTYFPQILEQIAAIPGVRSVAFSRSPVLGGQLVFVPVAVARSEGEVPIEQMIVSDEFFSTLGIPLTTGSPFEKNGKPSDVRRTAILSESAARALFGTAPVVGWQIRVGNNPLNQSLEIVGVAADAVMSSPQRRNVRVVYLNFWQWGNTIQGWADLVVRTDHDPVATADVVRRTVAGAGHEYVSHLHELTDQRDIALSQERLLATLSTAFGTLGLTLAAIGLYGILTFSVAQRTGEIGIRMALGADRMRVLALVLRDAAALVGVGILVGAPLAWAANSLAAPTLYGRTSTAIMPVATALVLMLIVSLMAVWLPARRASSIDPMQALRRE